MSVTWSVPPELWYLSAVLNLHRSLQLPWHERWLESLCCQYSYMFFNLSLSFHFLKKLNSSWRTMHLFKKISSLQLLCAVLPLRCFFSLSHLPFLSTLIYCYPPLSCRYLPLPCFPPSVTSVWNCYRWNSMLPERIVWRCCEEAKFTSPCQDLRRAAPFFAFSMHSPTFMSPGLQQFSVLFG